MATAIAERGEARFPSNAYGPYFEAQALALFLAGGPGRLTISIGIRQDHEIKRVAAVVSHPVPRPRRPEKARHSVPGQRIPGRQQRDINGR